MPKYKVNWDYASGFGGPWKKGEVIELEEGEAAAINVDSPKVLSRQAERKKAAPKKRAQPKQEDRQVKAAKNRS